MTHAGGLILVHRYVGDIHPGGGGGVGHDLAKGVVAHLAHHGHVGAQTGALHRLVGPFSSRRGLEFQTHHSLSRVGRALGGGDQIHHKAANYQDLRLFQHNRAPPILFMSLAQD